MIYMTSFGDAHGPVVSSLGLLCFVCSLCTMRLSLAPQLGLKKGELVTHVTSKCAVGSDHHDVSAPQYQLNATGALISAICAADAACGNQGASSVVEVLRLSAADICTIPVCRHILRPDVAGLLPTIAKLVCCLVIMVQIGYGRNASRMCGLSYHQVGTHASCTVDHDLVARSHTAQSPCSGTCSQGASPELGRLTKSVECVRHELSATKEASAAGSNLSQWTLQHAAAAAGSILIASVVSFPAAAVQRPISAVAFSSRVDAAVGPAGAGQQQSSQQLPRLVSRPWQVSVPAFTLCVGASTAPWPLLDTAAAAIGQQPASLLCFAASGALPLSIGRFLQKQLLLLKPVDRSAGSSNGDQGCRGLWIVEACGIQPLAASCTCSSATSTCCIAGFIVFL
jgi:hypothetical protein